MEESLLLDLSQTQRIVLLVDLHHPMHNPNSSSSYISSVIAAARTFLSFPPLSSSLFAVKLFFSSLSPLLSASTLHRLLGKSAAFFSFDRPSQTLISLSNALNSLPSLSDSSLLHSTPRASFTAQSLGQLAHDYVWESHIQDPKGTRLDFLTLPSNLIILFSPLPRSVKCLSEFMDVNLETDENCSASMEILTERFSRVFGAVGEGFAARDVNFSWVDVNFDQDHAEEQFGGDGPVLGFLESGIKGLRWGFCSTDAIVLGSALVPFGLIYPNIGCFMGSKISDSCKVGRAELSLAISDVNGQPLQCKCCDLELFDVKSSRGRSADLSRILECVDLSVKDSVQGKAFWRDGSNGGITKIHVEEVWKANEEGIKMKGKPCDYVLLREFSGKCGRERKRGGFLADRVLEMLQMEVTEFEAGKPTWQLLLTFLRRESYWALVSVSTGDMNSFMGILQPFTVHSAILCIVYNKHDFDSISSCWSKAFNKTDNDSFNGKDDLNCSNMFSSSQSSSSSYSFASGAVEGKRKRNKKCSVMLQDLTWSSFRKEVFSHSCEGTSDDIGPEMELEALYFSNHCNDSKKLRFLKCWMKQIKRCSGSKIASNEPKREDEVEEAAGRIVGSQRESELPICSSLVVGEASFSGSIKDENPTVSCLETLEAFSESISQKIQHSLNSEEVNLGLLAECILNSCIQWLSAKLEGNAMKNLTSKKNGVTHPAMIATEVEKLLLRKPRDLAAKYKGCDPSAFKSNWSFCVHTSAQKLREHELQILFRMEIFRSMIGASMEEPVKQKMIKEICSLLENIEFNLQGGLFGGESLVEFAGRTIKSRYASSLEDVIQRIYTQMEFLSFEDDDEEASSIPNSDSHGEERAKGEIEIVRNVGAEPVRKSSDMNSLSTDDEPPYPVEDGLKCTQMFTDMVHENKLKEARERRERALRFASFTRRVPDLQRVWVPKQPKVGRSKSVSHQKALGRKLRGDHREVVCETPLVRIKRTYTLGNDGDEKHPSKRTSNFCGSISKALFHRDGDATANSFIA